MRANKKKYVCVIVMSLLLSVNYQAAGSPETQYVVFADPNLSVCIANELNDTDGIITTGELKSITSLNCEGYEITSLEGIELATNLNYLNLSDNNITDISPISKLLSLTTLDLSNNEISDIDPLQNLNTIQDLFLSDNQIVDISVLSTLHELYHLELENNLIEDISGLSNINNLHHLYLAGNQITDVSPIADLTYISAIDLSQNQITDLSPLSSYPSNTIVYANDQHVTYDDLTVYNNEPIQYQVTGLNGISHRLEYYAIEPGENNVGIEWNYSTTNPNSVFTGVINQKIYYDFPSNLVGDDFHQVSEERVYTDNELIDLFNVTSSNAQEVSVNTSEVNYSVPGTYPISFIDENGGTLDALLEVVDVVPEINSEVDCIYVPINSNVDFITAFGISASEITTGDLNDQVVSNGSQIDLSKDGTYNIDFSVEDEEGNIVTMTKIVNVIEDSFTISEDENGNAKVYVQKVDEHGHGLGGYEYTIYDEEGNVVDVIVTDENGCGESKNLKDGDYTIVLTGTPEEASKGNGNDNTNTHGKYEGENSESSDIQTEVDNDKSQSNNIESESNKSQPNNSSTKAVKSKKQSSSPKLTPVVASTSEVISISDDTNYSKYQTTADSREQFQFEVVLENGAATDGIVFNIVDENGKVIQSVVSDENGIITIDPLPVGTYSLELASANDQYVLENEINISIDAENSVSEVPPVITLKEKHVNYGVAAAVSVVGIFAVLKMLPKLFSLVK